MKRMEFDTLVIGAGVAGLMAALEIALAGKSVAVIEAKDQAGGRIKTVEENSCPLELGAEFVHGNLPLTQQLLKEAGTKTYTANGSIWQYKNGELQEQEDFIEDYEALETKLKALKGDKPVADFLQENLAGDEYKELRFSLQNYVEGYYAADTTKASTAALREELTTGEDEQYRLEGSYRQLVEVLEKKCLKAGAHIFLSQPVLQLQWKKDAVTVVTEKGSFSGQKVVVTVSIGVLQRGGITFFPALPRVNKAVQALGFGHVLKLLLRFDEPFWKDRAFARQKDLTDMSFLFSEEEIPTWWTHFPKDDGILTGWLGGPKAANYQFLPAGSIEQKAIAALSRIIGLPAEYLQQKLKKMFYYNWSADLHFCGAYSYEVVGGGQLIEEMQQPVEETLFFAGEGLHQGKEIGTVEGALQSGKIAARRLLNLFSS